MVTNKSNFNDLKKYEYSKLFDIIHPVEQSIFGGKVEAIRTVEVRKYLEALLESTFRKVCPNQNKLSKLLNYSLFESLNYLGQTCPECWIISSMQSVRAMGNLGAHHSPNFNLSQSDLIVLLMKAHNIQLWFLEDICKIKSELTKFDKSIYTIDSNQLLINKTNQPIKPDDLQDVDQPSFKDEITPYQAQYNKISLSEDQKNLISLTTGKHFINAPPGTGKTQLLVARITSMC